MPSYTDEELQRYFDDPAARRRSPSSEGVERNRGRHGSPGTLRRFYLKHLGNARLAQAASAATVIAAFLVFATLVPVLYLLTLADELPTFEQLDNPELQYATVVYSADGRVLARLGRENRTWARIEDEISPHVVEALISSEDHRFFNHWGIDPEGVAAAAFETVVLFDPRGASTITQQLARNLYDEQIGKQVTVERKLKEMVTAVQLERRYTKREILEMYLNTVSFGPHAYGIEAAAQTFFDKPASDLDVLESATLVGMLRATSYYHPVRNPENARRVRNTVLGRMVDLGVLPTDYLAAHADEPVVTNYNPPEITTGVAPHFAEYVRQWLNRWSATTQHDIYADGLVVYTTLDARLQELAASAVSHQMEGLQRVVDYEWSLSAAGAPYARDLEAYRSLTGYEPFSRFWSTRRAAVNAFIRRSSRYRALLRQGLDEGAALAQLRSNEEFMDSLKTRKTRLEAGMVSVDPRSGFVKAWIGGREMADNWYDHVATARRQPGSTFKPFVYTAAIDNGYSPYYKLPDSTFTWVDPQSGAVWSPRNFGTTSGRMLTLAEGLATSNNLITARVITQLITPEQAATYAHRMGIESPLDEVPSLGLGTSDVTLLELVTAYSTLASGGLHYDPVVVTRIEDQLGHVLFESKPVPTEALSEETAYTVVDMLRGVIEHPQGTGRRIHTQWNLERFDLAAKTGTTQDAADGWFVLMHPDLVTGAWVGFDDRRVTFRTDFWGQGAHTALLLAGAYFRGAVDAPDVDIPNRQFLTPADFGYTGFPDPGEAGGGLEW